MSRPLGRARSSHAGASFAVFHHAGSSCTPELMRRFREETYPERAFHGKGIRAHVRPLMAERTMTPSCRASTRASTRIRIRGWAFRVRTLVGAPLLSCACASEAAEGSTAPHAASVSHPATEAVVQEARPPACEPPAYPAEGASCWADGCTFEQLVEVFNRSDPYHTEAQFGHIDTRDATPREGRGVVLIVPCCSEGDPDCCTRLDAIRNPGVCQSNANGSPEGRYVAPRGDALGTLNLNPSVLKQSHRELCCGMPFQNELVVHAASAGTGQVLPDGRVLTAQHNVFDNSRRRMLDRCVVFNWRRQSSGQSNQLQALRIEKVVRRGTGSGLGADWAIVRLDAPVPRAMRGELSVRAPRRAKAELTSFSHPFGSPLKKTVNGHIIRRQRNGRLLEVDLDSASGFSGAPLFDGSVLVGIAVYGSTTERGRPRNPGEADGYDCCGKGVCCDPPNMPYDAGATCNEQRPCETLAACGAEGCCNAGPYGRFGIAVSASSFESAARSR